MARLPDDLVVDLVDAGSREHYADAAIYDREYKSRRADVDYYCYLARQRLGDGGSILELGAGSGRITVPLARAGHHVVALDQSVPMLAALDARVAKLPKLVAPRITSQRGDLRDFTVAGKKFPLVIAAFNTFEHLYTRSEFAACLARVAAHLTPDGVLAFDVQLPDLGWLLRDPYERVARTRYKDAATGRAYIYSTSHEYDQISQIALVRLYYEPVDGNGPIRVVKLSQRRFFPAELEALVAYAGFRVVERYGDFACRPLDETAESQVLVCAPVAAARRKSSASRR